MIKRAVVGGKWGLFYKKTNSIVLIGDEVFSGEKSYIVTGGRKPYNPPNVAGHRVYVKEHLMSGDREFYPHVFDMEWREV